MNLEKAHICEKLPTVVSFIHPSLWKSSVMQEWKLDFNKKRAVEYTPLSRQHYKKEKNKKFLSLSL